MTTIETTISAEKSEEDAKNVITEMKVKKQTEMGTFPSIEEFAKVAFGELMVASKSMNTFPQGAQRNIYCTYPTFGKVIDKESNKILELVGKVLKKNNIRGNIQRRRNDEQFEMIQECNDIIFERINTNLDIISGVNRKTYVPIISDQKKIINIPTAKSNAGSWNIKKNNKDYYTRFINPKNVPRSQIKFSTPVDNTNESVFIPGIKDKPNALKPLAILPEYDSNGDISGYLHPYEYELTMFQVPQKQLQTITPHLPINLTKHSLIFVDTVPKLEQALQELKQHKELAVDVEHHSYRSYQGFTCLVQVSTIEKDYIFDTIELRDHMHILNEVFTDPQTVKVFHGAELDIQWLQRDLSLYVVNMFDSHQAARLLNFSRLSLAFILEHYCKHKTDKTLQMADWRIRPLAKEMLNYARCDTHYLIYVYHCMTNDLLEMSNGNSNLLQNVYQKSVELCSKRYTKHKTRTDSHFDMFKKSKRAFDNRQLYALQEIFHWRDKIARAEDESIGYILPNHMLLHISECLPREMQGILACCNPIPPTLKQRLQEVHMIILKAREQPLIKPMLERQNLNKVLFEKRLGMNTQYKCPFDLSFEEFRDDLPTLFKFENNKLVILKQPPLKSFIPKKSSLKIFDKTHPACIAREKHLEKILDLAEESRFLISPYQRYLAVLPLVQKEQAEEAERLMEELKKRRLCPDAIPEVVKVKEEKGDDAGNVDVNVDGSIENEQFARSVKAMLKRKYEESIEIKEANKSKIDKSSPLPKRSKKEVKTDNKTVNSPIPSKCIEKQSNKKFMSQSDDLQIQRLKEESHKGQKSTQTLLKDLKSQTSCPVNENSTAPSVPAVQTQQKAQESEKNSSKVFKNQYKYKSNYKYVKPQQDTQSSDRPVSSQNFNYAKVDYSKFRGGAQVAKGAEFKSKYNGKGNNAQKAANKKLNKIFTFTNRKSGGKK